MPLIAIETLDDPRIDLYRNLPDGDLTERGDYFMAEGSLVVTRLFQSDFQVHSVLISDQKLRSFEFHPPADVPVYVAPSQMMQDIVGFNFHKGVLAVARQRLYSDVDRLTASLLEHDAAQPLTFVVCPLIRNAQNLGVIIRCAAAFGAAAVVLGPGGVNPFWRYSVRVSMGAVFTVPIVRSLDLARDLRCLRNQWRFERIATVLDPPAESLPQVRRPNDPDRVAVLLGSEDDGLAPQWLDLCDRRVTIPIHTGTDSLNVAMAASVFLYHYTTGQA